MLQLKILSGKVVSIPKSKSPLPTSDTTFHRPLDTPPAIQQAGNMKATFQIPDELYREVKAQTAREGRTVRDVAINLFQQWLRQKNQPSTLATPTDWQNFQPPLSHLVPDSVKEHSIDAMRKSVTDQWNEPS